MLTPAYLVGAADEVVDTFASVETDIASDMAERIIRMGRVSETTAWQAAKMREFGLLQEDVSSILAQATGMSKRQVRRLMADAGMKSLSYDDAIYRAAGLTPLSLAKSPALQAVLLQGANSTLQLIGNLTKTTARASNVAFTSLLDRAYIQIMSGAYAPNRAIREAIRELASQGIERVAFPSGSAESIESSVRRAITTGVNQSISKLQLARAGDMGCQLVETSSHAGARPSHAEWQGQVFSLTNATREYPDFYRSTGYGDGDGLCGWNCYHSFFPFFEGISTRSFSSDPAADAGRDNAIEYEQQQKQRYYERQVRDAKKECTVLNAAVGASTNDAEREEFKSDFARASVTLKNREAALDKFLASTGRTRERDREQVGGFDRSVSGKAVWANRKAHSA